MSAAPANSAANTATSAAALHAALAGIFPGDRLLIQPGQLVPYEFDGLTAYHARPAAVVIADLAGGCDRGGQDLPSRCRCHSWRAAAAPACRAARCRCRTAWSSPSTGSTVSCKLDPAQRVAVVEPGVINLDVSKAAAPYGLYYAPDPSSQQICTIGGNIAFNSGGAHCLKYGMTSNHVLGVKAVLADGEVVQLGGDSLESVGPDLLGLFVGSEGLFGVGLEITLRLLPRPERYRNGAGRLPQPGGGRRRGGAGGGLRPAAGGDGDHGPAGHPGGRGGGSCRTTRPRPRRC